MEKESPENKTIAKNTLYLYVRTFVTMLITLYTSRVVLAVLGFDDYGIYNAIGGISASFVFLSSMLSNATQRYLNFAIGQNDETKANQVFNMNMLIYLVYGILSVLFVEIVGLWFIANKMVISPERLNAAYWCLHTTVIILFVSLISSVYESVLISRENMKIYAYMGIYDAIVKLLIVFLISIFTFDKLKIYSVLMAIMHISARLIPVAYTIRHYHETKLICYFNRNSFADMSKFIGWNFVSTSVFILNDQGINMLLNMFFGPAVNAARAVSVQVKNSISNFAMGFFTAVRPQIVKSYAIGDNHRFIELVFNSGKYTFYLLWIICLPVMVRIDNILSFWLKNIPDWTGEFVVWILIFNLINSSLCDPIWQGMQAIGKLNKFVLIGSIVYLIAFPITWITFKYDSSPLLAFQILVYIRLAYFMVTIHIFKNYIYFTYRNYILSVIVPIIKVVIISTTITVAIDKFLPKNIIATLLSLSISLMVSAVTVYYLGIKKTQRVILTKTIKRKLCKKQ